MKLVSFSLLLFLLLSCNPDSKKANLEENKGYHDNGNLAQHYYLKDGKREGVYKEYYPSGKIQIERHYQSDSILSEKITDINGKILVNYVIKKGNYYGLLGSSSCLSIYHDEKFQKKN